MICGVGSRKMCCFGNASWERFSVLGFGMRNWFFV